MLLNLIKPYLSPVFGGGIFMPEFRALFCLKVIMCVFKRHRDTIRRRTKEQEEEKDFDSSSSQLLRKAASLYFVAPSSCFDEDDEDAEKQL